VYRDSQVGAMRLVGDRFHRLFVDDAAAVVCDDFDHVRAGAQV
jgi:hypothetical protein